MAKIAKKILVSGVKPTGKLHIGNFLGAIKQMVELQDKYDTRIFIADLHALTSVTSAKELSENTLNLAIDYIAAGINPKKVLLYKQSDVPQVAELAWMFNCITTMPYLMRAHAFKDAEAKNREINVGVFEYPMLMAADILIHNPHVVPVGLDQKQHLEITRDTAQKFNNTFGETFILPDPLIDPNTQTVPGTDGQKMSKSYGNTIGLFASDEEITKAVMSIPTDSKSVEEPKDPSACKVFALHKFFTPNPEFDQLHQRYINGGIGYKESKDILIKNLIAFIKPMRERREKLAKSPKKILTLLKKNGKKANKLAEKMMSEVRTKIGTKLY